MMRYSVFLFLALVPGIFPVAVKADNSLSLQNDKEVIEVLLRQLVFTLPPFTQTDVSKDHVSVSDTFVSPVFPKLKSQSGKKDFITTEGHAIPGELTANAKLRSQSARKLSSINPDLSTFFLQESGKVTLPLVEFSLPIYTAEKTGAGVYMQITSAPWGLQTDSYFILLRSNNGSWKIAWTERMQHSYVPGTRE